MGLREEHHSEEAANKRSLLFLREDAGVGIVTGARIALLQLNLEAVRRDATGCFCGMAIGDSAQREHVSGANRRHFWSYPWKLLSEVESKTLNVFNNRT